MNLKVITAPATEPVSAATAKLYLRVDSSDDDTLITNLIKAARLKGEELSRRAFITQTLEMTFDVWPADYQLKLLRPPLLTVTSVKYLDEDNVEHTVDAGDYIVNVQDEPGVIIFEELPSDTLLETGAIAVRYTAGYGAAATNVPDDIIQNLLQLIAYWYENREAGDVPPGIAAAFKAKRVVWC